MKSPTPNLKFKVTLNGPANRGIMTAIHKAMAETVAKQTKKRIRQGGDDEVRFAPLDFPRKDGSKNRPLFHTGQHLMNSIKPGYTAKSAWAETDFIGAEVLLLGTVGKGGELPTIKPKKPHGVIVFPGHKGMVFSKKVDINPRPYMRFSKRDVEELQDVVERSINNGSTAY